MTETQGWTWTTPGNAGQLQLHTVQLAAPAAGEVLVENRLAAVNPVDWKLIESGHPAWQPGQIPGVDGMGVIVALGAGVNHLRLGSRVAYHTDLRCHGSFARHTLVPARALLAVPEALSDEAAASFPCPGLTAWQAIGKLPALHGEALLIAGAGSSVGRFAAHLALARGARVFASASTQHHQALLASGVQAVADYRQDDWLARLREANGGEPFYAAIDVVSSSQSAALAAELGYYGHLVSVLGRVEHNPCEAFTRCLSLHEIALGAQHAHGSNHQWHKLVAAGNAMLAAMADGSLPTAPLTVRPFAELPAVVAEAARHSQGGKWLLRL